MSAGCAQAHARAADPKCHGGGPRCGTLGDEMEAGFDGALTRLEVAFSREGEEKVYVQHRMRAAGEELYEKLLECGETGRIMVCGDGAAMAKDVHAELESSLSAAALKAMKEEGRYVRDIWS